MRKYADNIYIYIRHEREILSNNGDKSYSTWYRVTLTKQGRVAAGCPNLGLQPLVIIYIKELESGVYYNITNYSVVYNTEDSISTETSW